MFVCFAHTLKILGDTSLVGPCLLSFYLAGPAARLRHPASGSSSSSNSIAFVIVSKASRRRGRDRSFHHPFHHKNDDVAVASYSTLQYLV